MSEKRFTLTDWHEVKDNGKIMTVDEVVGKLNELNNENEQLKQKLENIGLNEKNDMVKMVDGKFFIRI